MTTRDRILQVLSPATAIPFVQLQKKLALSFPDVVFTFQRHILDQIKFYGIKL